MKLAMIVAAALLPAVPAYAQSLPAGLAKMDADKDGKVSSAEWSADKAASFTRLDANKDGAFDRDEIVKRYAKDAPDGLEERIARFLKPDTNGDGKVSRAEEDVADQADFRRRDKNGDGFVSADETAK